MRNRFKIGKEYTFISTIEHTEELIEVTVKIVGRGEDSSKMKYVIVNFTGSHNEERIYDLYTDFSHAEKIIIKSVGKNQLSEPFDLYATQPNADIKKLADDLEDYLTFYKVAGTHFIDSENKRINYYLMTRLEQSNVNAANAYSNSISTAYSNKILTFELTNEEMTAAIKEALTVLKEEIL